MEPNTRRASPELPHLPCLGILCKDPAEDDPKMYGATVMWGRSGVGFQDPRRDSYDKCRASLRRARKNLSSDRTLMLDLVLWTVDDPPPAHLFVTSTDSDLSSAFHLLRMKNYNVLLACNSHAASLALLAAASAVWQWGKLAREEGPVAQTIDFHKDICALLQQAALTLSQKPPESMLLSVTLGERMIAPQQQRTGEFPRGKLLRARRLSVNAVKVKDGNLVGSPARQVLSPVPETKESGRGEGFVRIRDGGSGKRQKTAKQIEEIALGLEASKVPFLWVIRSNSVLRMDEEGFVSRTGGRGLFVSWALQLETLQHESTGAFVTHCS
ncbi:hypothetical protein SELMODRAFT_419609 [Selaginella moellendorffii]|uniref:NYN domain-containing protein n=1 Tax=Selaginella moellendorffii TaxID=88036 RepID=D8S9H2_SELML|nr:hypothetical protein SELMODRAFT_419609 [Selaginella moellendorffii]